MSDQQTPGAPTRNRTVFFLLSILLIGTFLWRVFVPAHEYLIRSAQLLEMAVDAICVVGLFGIRNSGPKALFWAGLIAGIGLFVIRMTGESAWWTGHLSYSLLPR